ncbi:c-type cytochrome [Halomonas salipaludis]|uniref:Cytochrome C n=1 Tax=Halomonas salipaludis TaxID=2032625 RepID=A0A2A2EQ77_9GAMM|nr:cytochrome c [Halomonas salipaludis]PAU74549.1 cytochrome C [Halomonas salipaludis]
MKQLITFPLITALPLMAALPASADGESLYQQNCSACHMVDGSGIQGAFPALTDSDFVAGDLEDLIRVVAYGRAGMPSFGEELASTELAEILGYIRETFNDTDTDLSASDIERLKVTATAKMGREE